MVLSKKIVMIISVCVFMHVAHRRMLSFVTRPVSLTLLSPLRLFCFSPEYCSYLQAFFEQNCTTCLRVGQCSTLIAKQFPALKNITLRYMGGRILAHVQPARPVALINKQYVLTDTDQVTDLSVWSPSVIRDIPAFSVADLSVINSENRSFLKHMAYEVQGVYDLEWVGESLIKFRDNQHPHITVLGSVATNSKTVLQHACLDLKEEIIKKKTGRKGQCDWCIDVRFKNQMIVFLGGRA